MIGFIPSLWLVACGLWLVACGLWVTDHPTTSMAVFFSNGFVMHSTPNLISQLLLLLPNKTNFTISFLILSLYMQAVPVINHQIHHHLRETSEKQKKQAQIQTRQRHVFFFDQHQINPPKYNMEGLSAVLIILFLSSFVLLSHSLAPPGTIQRVTKQQLLASLPPSEHDTASLQLFLTSPSAKYAVYLLRRETTLGAGGFGNDFCYLQVQDSAAGGASVWESDCTSVSNVNTCTLLFSEGGLEIFDGSQSAWDNDVDGENLETLVLMDSGDMQIRDKDGDVVWKASDNPVVNQNCGSIGAPGLAPDHPTFGSPIHDDSGPFGQPAVDSPVVQQPHHPDQLGVSVQPPHQLGTSSPGPVPVPVPVPEEENQQPQQEPAAVAASPEEQEHQSQQEPTAFSPDEQEHQGQQEQAAASHPEEQGPQAQQEPAASPEVETEHNHPLNHHPIGTRSQQPYSSLNQQQQQSIPVGVAAHQQQPLIDNTPFDSGSSREKPYKFGVTLFFLITTLMTYNFLLV